MSFDASFAPLDPDNIDGTYAMFNMIRVGGIWGVPRSGLVYQRTTETTLVLTDRMPWMPEMQGTITAEQLAERQQSDHDGMVAHLAAAGVTVTDSTCNVQEPFGPDNQAEYCWSCGPAHVNPTTDSH